MRATSILSLLLVLVLLSGCASQNAGGPEGMTGTGGPGTTGTTGTGTAAPTGTAGAGTTGSGGSGKVIPKLTEDTEAPDDASITAAITQRLSEEEGLNAQSIVVQTDDGVVTLKGTVQSEEEAERIIELVRSVENVKSVSSELTVQ